MVDLHTHILPNMDDGASGIKESLALLKAEKEQGVDTVVLTPHFRREHETVEQFLRRRQESYETLCAALPPDAPKLVLGAEVAWFENLVYEPQLSSLVLGNSRYILLELPKTVWKSKLPDQIYQFAGVSGLTPILAHLDKYDEPGNRAAIRTLVEMQFPMQMSADAFSKPFTRCRATRMMKRGAWLLGSDCHNTARRPCMYGMAAEYVKKHIPGAEYILNLYGADKRAL